MEAYISGLETYAADPDADLSRVASVASFFISRVDTEVDRRLEAIGTEQALALRGKAAVAQGKLAYRLFRETFSGARWEALAARGRPGPAPAVGEHRHQEPGLLRHAVRRRADRSRHGQHAPRGHDRSLRRPRHGCAARSTPTSTRPKRVWAALADVGVDMDDVSDRLEREGVDAFTKSFDELIEALQAKVDRARGS